MTATASATASHSVDVAIVGGGMVGASLAVALRDSPLTVALIEGFAPDAAAQPSFDDRTTAIGNGSRAVFEGLGAPRPWPSSLPGPLQVRQQRQGIGAA